MEKIFLDKIKQKRPEIESWLKKYEENVGIPIYLSTDIRDADFKMAVVDSNLFPAGFNNICKDDLEKAPGIMKNAIARRITKCDHILLYIEEHTRNKWYLEHVYTLKKIMEKAGFNITIATSGEIEKVNIQNGKNKPLLNIETQLNNSFQLYPISSIFPHGTLNGNSFDLILLNNDLTQEVPSFLKETKLQTIPSFNAGWHTRQKSFHFRYQYELLLELSGITGIDPWFFSCLDKRVPSIDINSAMDREKLFDLSSDLLNGIQKKYKEYNILKEPFIFLKADYGTYGMAVLSIKDPMTLKNLNRKARNKLSKGKGSTVISSYLLQEGVPSIHKVDKSPAEVCLYQIDNQYIGSFYRVHEMKSDTDNLNSSGMYFKSIGKDRHSQCKDFLGSDLLYSYYLLSRIAGLACMKEIQELDEEQKYEVCLSN